MENPVTEEQLETAPATKKGTAKTAKKAKVNTKAK